MSDAHSSPESSSIDRRDFLARVAGASGALALRGSNANAAGPEPDAERRPKLIREENQRPGARDWQLTRVRPDKDGFRSVDIEGYCSRQSVKAGESIEIMVSTRPARRFQIEVFRMGYYGGRGARLMTTLGPFDGQTQPTPTPGPKNLHECRWTPTTRLTIPADWPSGVYLGRLTTLVDEEKEPYWQSYVVFVVRDDRPADILFQCSDNTWQAYNRWPNNYSVYTHPKGNQGPWADVSFDRPYGREAQYTGVVNDPLTVGSGEFLPLEFPLAYWLEQHGYDVTYCCNTDMMSPDRGLKCKVFISVGHDEYWDIQQHASVVKMRDEGVNLLFFSGNTLCWVTPFRASSDGRPNRIMFRGGPYGAENDYARRREKEHGPFPERGPDEGLLMGVRNVEPVNGGGDWVITQPDHWIFTGTGVKKGDRIPGLIGWEYHGDPAAIPGLEVVAGGTAWVGGVTPQKWAATIYPGPKGNFVFNASTIFWAQGMSSPPGHTLPWSHWSRPHGPDERVQTITRNLLDRALRPR
ncbi:MAG: DUF6605 domain-containing protein [Isosphaeraceae bacterium]